MSILFSLLPSRELIQETVLRLLLPAQNQVRRREATLLELHRVWNRLYLHSTQSHICTEETTKKPFAGE